MAASKKFYVKNGSERLVNILGVMAAPGQTVSLEDNEENRASIKNVPGLSVGNKNAAEPEMSETEKLQKAAIDEANKKPSATATGAGWGSADTNKTE